MEQIKSGHITPVGNMTIVNAKNKLNFITDMVGIDSSLELGKVYELEVDHQFGDMWLAPVAALPLPSKIYDFEQGFRDQVLTTLRSLRANNNIGVLLEGYKGQGKSVIAKQLAIESGLPVILINQAIPKIADFTSYLNQIKQDYVLLIDEFEKIFAAVDNSDNKFHAQEKFLTFLDGTNALSNKRLVIFTTNSEIGDKFINRPTRIRYYKKFNFMTKQVFEAILADKLENLDHKQDLEDNLDIASCTIDLLTTIIDEINIHDKPYSSFKDFFNHKEKAIVYSKYRREKDGTWKFIEDVTSQKEIGVESEYAKNIFGWHIKVLKNDGETIYYENRDYIDPKDDEDETMEMFTFKAIKQKWEKSTLVF